MKKVLHWILFPFAFVAICILTLIFGCEDEETPDTIREDDDNE